MVESSFTERKERDTLPKLISHNYRTRPGRTAMCVKRFGIWQRYSWEDYYNMVKYLSMGMINLGLEKGDVVCIIGDNKPQWLWAEFAAQAAGGIATGIFVDSIPAEVRYIANHSKARFAVVNDQEQTDKFLEIKGELPNLERVIYWNPKGMKDYDDPLLVYFDEVLRKGKEYGEDCPGFFENRIGECDGQEPAFIYYTPGTTGLPKGAILTHRALINTASSFLSRYRVDENDDLVSNFPAAWIGDGFFATLPHLITGARLNFPEEPETIAVDTREIGPTLIANGPRQWEILVREIRERMSHAGPLQRLSWRRFLPVGYRMADAGFQDNAVGRMLRLKHRVANAVLFKPLQDRLGLSRVKFAVTGGSVLSLDIFRMIHAIGVELRQNYATTEAGFVSCHREGEIRPESVGRPVVGTEVRVTDEGELLVRSESLFHGYYRDDDRSARILAGGWCRTGDAVSIDDDGHLIFMDHLEHMGKLSTGARYSPQYVEGRLRFSRHIQNAIVIGGRDRSFVSAILNIDAAAVRKWAEHQRLPHAGILDLAQKEEVARLVLNDLAEVNDYLPEPVRIKKFVLLHKEFDPDEAELTRTRKLRRAFIEERYRELINAIYRGDRGVEIETPVSYCDDKSYGAAINIRIWTV
ncbi:MAG: AMP-binding protein [Dehalococcoidales bacterium]